MFLKLYFSNFLKSNQHSVNFPRNVAEVILLRCLINYKWNKNKFATSLMSSFDNVLNSKREINLSGSLALNGHNQIF